MTAAGQNDAKPNMRKQNIKKLGLGTVQFGLDYGISNRNGVTGIEEIKKIIDFARGAGIDLIDTAYGYGRSEEVLGLAGVQEFKIVSKFMPESQSISIPEQVKTSLERLNTKSLYGLLAHRPLDVSENPKIWNYLQELKKKGVVEKIGFSFNKPEEAEMVFEGGFIPDLIQAPFNYFDNRFQNIMIKMKEKGCEIHSRSAFLQGLFFISANDLPGFFKDVKPEIYELQKNKEALPGLLLKYCLEKPFIDKVIVGVNNLAQLQHNINALDGRHALPEFNKQIKINILTPSLWPKKK
jgi:aryl-alcohol dehydrogenase-like predicted oxidoreductase